MVEEEVKRFNYFIHIKSNNIVRSKSIENRVSIFILVFLALNRLDVRYAKVYSVVWNAVNDTRRMLTVQMMLKTNEIDHDAVSVRVFPPWNFIEEMILHSLCTCVKHICHYTARSV